MRDISKAKVKEHLLTKGEGLMADVVDRVVSFFRHEVSPVLVVGESGSGKEYVARVLLSNGDDFDKTDYTSLNCAAINQSTLFSELFGHTKGAFTDACKAREGILRRSDGHVFLDEIDKSSLEFQNAMLRYFRHGEIRPLGSDKVEPVSGSRIVLATSMPFEAVFGRRYQPLWQYAHEMHVEGLKSLDPPRTVQTGRQSEQEVWALRQGADLYDRILRAGSESPISSDFLNRIATYTIEMPPLRTRLSDLPTIIEHIVKKGCQELSKKVNKVSGWVIRFVLVNSWPGNVAEIEDFIKNGLLFAKADTLELEACTHYFGSQHEALVRAIAMVPGTRPGQYIERYLGIGIDYYTSDRQPIFTEARRFKLNQLERTFENALFWLNADRQVASGTQPSGFDVDKVNQYYELRNRCDSQKDIFKKMGFKSLDPFKNWMKKNHLD